MSLADNPRESRTEARSVRIEARVADGKRCVFVVDRPVLPERWVFFPDAERAEGSPLAERLFAIDGVASVLLAHNKVTITRDPPPGPALVGPLLRGLRAVMGDRSAGVERWPALGRKIGAAIREHLRSGAMAASKEAIAAMPSAAALRDRIQRVLDEQVNPVIADHGGGVAIVDVRDNVLYLQMWGGCQGCGLADVTLSRGVEAAVREAIPELGEIIDLTDHSAGKRPFAQHRFSPFASR